MTLGLPPYLESKINPEPNSGCWLWEGALSGPGYGLVKIPKTRRNDPVHRAVFKLLRSAIPLGMVLDHKCRVRICCNPDHLEIVTHAVNILRGTGASARNAVKIVCDSGHDLSDHYLINGNRRCKKCHSRNCAKSYARRKGVSR